MRRGAGWLAIALVVAATAGLAAGCGGDDDGNAPAPVASPARTPVPGSGGPARPGTPGGSATLSAAAAEAVRALTALPIPTELVDGATMGKADATVTLEVFEDFQCPFCLRFTANLEPVLINEYVKTGKVRLVFRHFPILGGESNNAALASGCAARLDGFWPYHRALFLKQAQAGQLSAEKLNVGRFTLDELIKLAGEAGIEATKFTACITAGDSLKDVQDDLATARSLGIPGTPGLVINGKRVPTPTDAAGLRTLLDNALAGR